MTGTMSRILIGMTLATAVAALPLSATADTIHVGSGLKFEDVQVLGIEGNEIRFINRTGRQTARELSQVTRLEITDEPAFNEAEAAYAAGDWEKATTGYDRTIRRTNKPWLKQWASLRLFETADKAGNFPAATTAYIELLRTNFQAAAGKQPTLPDANSTFLETAAQEVERALERNLEDRQRAELLKFLLDIHQKRGDTTRALSAAQRLGALTGDAATPENRRLVANLKLGLARIALEQKQYQKAIDEINGSREAFTEPQQQADALFVVAAAQHKLAGDNRDKLQDAAIAYMRVVAHFPDSPLAGDALVQTAAIMEALGEQKKALALYQQAAAEYPASGAKSHVQRLENGG